PCWEQGISQGQPAPRVPAASLGPRAGPEPGPAVGGERRQHRFHLVLAPSTPAIFLARDRQDVRLGALPPPPPPPLSAIDAIARPPGRWHLRIARAREQRACQLRL